MPSKKVRAKKKQTEVLHNKKGDTAYIHVGTYFPQFKEYVVMTHYDNLEEAIKKCKKDMDKPHAIKSFRDEDNGKYYVGIMEGKDDVKASMESMKESITKYTPFMINHLRDTNDQRYITWNTDIALYVAYNAVINQERIVLVDPSVVSSQLN